VLDFIDNASVLRKRADNLVVLRIKHLAALWRGCPQSCPQQPWRKTKLDQNQRLTALPSGLLQVLPVSFASGW
jgi:hypothetical protein